MKKLLLMALLCSQFMHAQDTIPGSKLPGRKNEFRVDVLSLVALSKVNLSYERFLNKDFSVGLSGSVANSNKVNDDFDSGNRNTIPKYEITPYVRYSLSKSLVHYYFFEVFADANGGDFRETLRLNDGANGYYSIQKTNYFDVAAGASVGYKTYVRDRLSIEFLVGFGRNLTNTAKSPDVIARVGLSVGYRF